MKLFGMSPTTVSITVPLSIQALLAMFVLLQYKTDDSDERMETGYTVTSNGLSLGDRGDSEMVCLLRRAGLPPLFAKPHPRGRMKKCDESDWGHLCKTGVLWPCLRGA